MHGIKNVIQQNKLLRQVNKQLKKQEQDKSTILLHKYEGKWLAIGDSITYNDEYQGKVVQLCNISKVITC